jgi:phosphoribosylglycinamide formyltransferase-1
MSSERPRLAILASGGGTTAEAFLFGVRDGIAEVDVPIVITNNRNAGVLGRVAAFSAVWGLNIRTEVVNSFTHPGEAEPGAQSREEAEAIAELLAEEGVEHVALLGYMKKVIPSLDTINTHPGLLPVTRGRIGLEVQRFAIEQGHEFAGQTLHQVDGEYDTGAIIAEHRVRIYSDHTPETLFDDVQKVEKANIAADIDAYLKGELIPHPQRSESA